MKVGYWQGLTSKETKLLEVVQDLREQLRTYHKMYQHTIGAVVVPEYRPWVLNGGVPSGPCAYCKAPLTNSPAWFDGDLNLFFCEPLHAAYYAVKHNTMVCADRVK